MSARRRESAEPFVSGSTADTNRSADCVWTSSRLRLTGTHGFGLRCRDAFDEEFSHGGTGARRGTSLHRFGRAPRETDERLGLSSSVPPCLRERPDPTDSRERRSGLPHDPFRMLKHAGTPDFGPTRGSSRSRDRSNTPRPLKAPRRRSRRRSGRRDRPLPGRRPHGGC
jgi:hypothetical protein